MRKPDWIIAFMALVALAFWTAQNDSMPSFVRQMRPETFSSEPSTSEDPPASPRSSGAPSLPAPATTPSARDISGDSSDPCVPGTMTSVAEVGTYVDESGLPAGLVPLVREWSPPHRGYAYDVDGDGVAEYFIIDPDASGARWFVVNLFVLRGGRWTLAQEQLWSPHVNAALRDGHFFEVASAVSHQEGDGRVRYRRISTPYQLTRGEVVGVTCPPSQRAPDSAALSGHTSDVTSVTVSSDAQEIVTESAVTTKFALASTQEDFEAYAIGSWPTRWVGDGNATDRNDNKLVVDPEGGNNKTLRLFGEIGSFWAAIGNLPCDIVSQKTDFFIEFRVFNGTESIPTSGHQIRGAVGLGEKADWRKYGRHLISFQKNGSVLLGDSRDHGHSYATGRWYNVRIRYQLTGTSLSLSYWLDGEFLKTISLTVDPVRENSLAYLTISAQAGSAFYDDVVVY